MMPKGHRVYHYDQQPPGGWPPFIEYVTVVTPRFALFPGAAIPEYRRERFALFRFGRKPCRGGCANPEFVVYAASEREALAVLRDCGAPLAL